MKKTILNLVGAQELTKKEQKIIQGGVVGPCRNLGDTGQICNTTSDCTGSGDPVCFRGCCNILV